MTIGAVLGCLFAGSFILTLAFLLLLGSYDGIEHHDSEDRMMEWQRKNGQWQVRYPDGRLSQPFTRAVAEDYADLFHGTVVPKKQ